MRRQLFCYISWFLTVIFVCIFTYVMIYSYNNNWKLGPFKYLAMISVICLCLMILPLLFTILLYGTPKNSINDFYIKCPRVEFLKSNETMKVVYNSTINMWESQYGAKKLKFDVSGLINQKQRIIDILYIQFHNYKFNYDKVKNIKYLSRLLDKNINITFVKNDKMINKKFKSSFLLKLKMLIPISQFRNHKVNQNEHVIKDLYDTFLIVK